MSQHNEDPKYTYAFDPTSENNTAAAIYRLVEAGGPRILDIGSGPAIVSSQFARRPGYRVVCADMDTAALEVALEAGVHEVHAVDLDLQDWHTNLPREQFDSIILADVLEHLRKPQMLLASIFAEGFLAPGGQLVISVPNATHSSVVGSLLAGDFAYTETGILDETHVRWFTLTSLTRMLDEQGYRIDALHRTIRTLEQTQQSPYRLSLTESGRQALHDMGLEGQTLQYVVTATHRGATPAASTSQSAIDQMRHEFDLASKALVLNFRNRAEEAEAEAVTLRSQLAEAGEARTHQDAEIENLRALLEEERSAALREFESLTHELATHQRNARRLRSQVNEVTSSTSWKVARILSAGVHPIDSVRKLLERGSKGKSS